MKVALIGMGVVGKAQAELFKGHSQIRYDPAENRSYPPRKSFTDCRAAIVSVGTPQGPDGAADLSCLEAAVRKLPPKLPVLVRSTIPPGTMARLERAYPDRLWAHAPEFLHERPGGAWSRSAQVPFMVLGASGGQALDFFRHTLRPVFPGRIHECSSAAAEMVKYVANLHWAVKVTFVNEMAGIARAVGADWEEVRRAWLADPRVSEDYTRMAGFPPGFGGRCWPKDLAAMIHAAEEAGYDPEFLWSVQGANDGFTRQGEDDGLACAHG